jgi:hypothetical protein
VHEKSGFLSYPVVILQSVSSPSFTLSSNSFWGSAMRHAQSTFDLDARIRAIASNQLGLVTVQQAKQAGVDKHALAKRRSSGALVPMFTQVMRLASCDPTPQQRVLAAALAVPGSVVAATSAAIIHQMPLAHAVVRDHAVLSVSKDRLIRIPGITVVRQTVAPPSTRWVATRVTTPAATLLLLPRFVDELSVERCLDHCLARRLTTVKTVRVLIECTSPRAIPGRTLLVDLLAARSGGIGHRSGKERDVGKWLDRAGLTGWAPNLKVQVSPNEDIEVDFGWAARRVALEASPFFTHGSRAQQERDAYRRRMLILAGWRIVEAVDHDLGSERAFASIVRTLQLLMPAA